MVGLGSREGELGGRGRCLVLVQTFVHAEMIGYHELKLGRNPT